MKKILIIALLGLMTISLFSCSQMDRGSKGAIIGAAAGAVLGGFIGDQAGNTTAGILMGAVVGGAAGAYIGEYMDRQAAEMRRDLENAEIERIGEGIKVTFQSGILFDVNKANLRGQAQTNLRELATILKKYEKTEILVEGHTDSTGSEDYNMDLSIRRSESVANFLYDYGVQLERFTVVGFGEMEPVAPNSTVQGRQKNRRVEIAIYANDELKDQAERMIDEQS